ncbi:glycosyltransferase family 39 protein [Dankookia sp. P2]|uniref:glycosyltransferase family 39 protein n=1 Tax=Dankookia sp. P2 TaxID=3423955 RepID=UPI003D67890F
MHDHPRGGAIPFGASRPGWLTGQALAVFSAAATITLLGLALRLHQIGEASLWSDEAFSAWWIHKPLGYLWTDGLVIETTPPLYYSLLKVWAGMFGDGDAALRLFSAAAGTATIPVVFLLGLEIAGPVVGLVAAMLFAMAPMQIYFAQEARVYALLPLAFALALLGLLRFVGSADHRGAQADRGALALYAAGMLVLLYAHATSVFTAAALASCGGLVLLRTPRKRAALRPFILAHLAIGVLALPLAIPILAQAGRHDLSWIKPPDLIGLLSLADHLVVDPVTPLRLFRLASILSLAAMSLLVALAVPLLRADRRLALLLAGVPGSFLVATILLSYVSPFLIPRIVIWMGVPLSLLAAMALVGPAPRWIRACFALAYAGCILVGLNGVYVRTLSEKEDWRGLMANLLPRLGAEDIVAIGPDTSLMAPLRYAEGSFSDNGRQLFRWHPQPHPEDLYTPDRIKPPVVIGTEALAQEARRGRTVWVLLRATDWAAQKDAAFAASRPPAEVDRTHPALVLLRW